MVYLNKGSEGQRLDQQVALVRQGCSETATWEDNGEDGEDSATPVQSQCWRAGLRTAHVWQRNLRQHVGPKHLQCPTEG